MDQPRNRHVPNTKRDNILRVCGLRWHGPISVVGAPIRSDGYGVVAPPRIWGRGTATRPAVLLQRPVQAAFRWMTLRARRSARTIAYHRLTS